jgi:aspartate aminotransferase
MFRTTQAWARLKFMSENDLAARVRSFAASATAAVFEEAAALQKKGVDLVSLAIGEPDFDAPEHVRQATARAAERGSLGYTQVAGLPELRQAIADDSARRRGVRHDPSQIVVSAGAKHSLFNLSQVLFDVGDEVIIPTPAWGSYVEQVRLAGATPILVPCAASDGFRLDPDALRAALSPRTKAVVFCDPCNPTGACHDRDRLLALGAVLADSRAFVITDEIYAELVYDGGRAVSLAGLLPGLAERLIVVDGVSKRYAMTGFRLGWCLAPPQVARACVTLQSQATTSVSTLSQHAAIAALSGEQGWVAQMREQLQARRNLLVEGLAALPGIRAERPRGAFYVFADVSELLGRQAGSTRLDDDVALARWLLHEARVAAVPGTGFFAPGHLRFSYTQPLGRIELAIERMANALATLS